MKWIDVKEKLPDVLTDVAVLIPQRDIVTNEKTGCYLVQTAYRSCRDRWLINCYDTDQSKSGVGYTKPDQDIDYWMSLPKLPKIKTH